MTYKAIWNKTKNQYVVSELLHSSRKQRRTAKKSLSKQIAVLVVCGAVVASGVLPAQQIFANAAKTQEGQYIAIGHANKDDGISDGNGGFYKEFEDVNGESHKYIYTEVKDYGSFWVREGFTIDIEENPRYGGGGAGEPRSEIVINTYKGEGADTEGLVQAYENVQKSMNITTINKDELFSTNTAIYGGAVNSDTFAITVGQDFIINEGENLVTEGNGLNLNGGQDSYFQPVNYDSRTGLYHFGDINSKDNIVSTENLYVIGETVGVFTKIPGGKTMDDIYTGDVYGNHNEILVTGIDDNGDYVSYWGTEVYDPNAPIGSMTISTLQGKFDEVNNNIEKIHKDDIKEIQVKENGDNGGIIGLQTNGNFDKDGNPIGGEYIPGTITIQNTEDSGKNGEDVKIQFGSIDENGNNVPVFTVDAGSKVEANPEITKEEEVETLDSISINGQKYELDGGAWNLTTNGGTEEADKAVSIGKGATVDFSGVEKSTGEGEEKETHSNVIVNKTTTEDGKTNVTFDLNNDLRVDSITSNKQYVTEVDANNGNSVVNVDYFKGNDFYLRNGETSLGTDFNGNNISFGEGENKVTTGYKADENGNIDMIVANNDGEQKHVVLTDIASKEQQDKNTETLKGAVMYDKTEDGEYDFTSVTLGGSNSYNYNEDDPTQSGGVELTNVAYATTNKEDENYNGSAAVNVDLLEDYVDENGGGAWNLTVNGGTEEADKAVSIGKGATVDFSGAEKSTGEDEDEETHSNVIVNKTTEDGKTNITFDLANKVILGSEDNQIILDSTSGNVFIGGSDGISITRDLSYNNGYIMSGLANTTWNPSLVDVSVKEGGYMNSTKAATEAQLNNAFSYLNNKIDYIDDNNMEILPGDGNISIDHVDNREPEENTSGNTGTGTGTDSDIATGSGTNSDAGIGSGTSNGAGPGTGNDISTETGSNAGTGSGTNHNTHYVSLENSVTIGGKDDNSNGKLDPEEEGSIVITRADDESIFINKDLDNDGKGDGVISGLTNIEWDYDKYQSGGYVNSSNGATEAQLHQAMQGTVQYDRNGDGTVNKGSITLGGEEGTVIHNVAPGTEATDAANVGQLAEVANNSYTAIDNIGNKVNKLSNRIDKVGAGAAALAALHPLDFDPDDKLSFAAGYGNYAGESAVAVGAFYQPNEDTMFSVGGTFGNDENMVNAGVSFKLGQKSNVSRSRVSMAKELVSLRDEVSQLKTLVSHAGIIPSNGQLDTSDMFPDVPENHWAYEYIHDLAKLGIVDGYPDGNYEGDRMMTRYEMAALVYRAMQKGVNVDRKMVKEFEPELKLIRVDVVAKDKNGNPTIERVRLNNDVIQQAY